MRKTHAANKELMCVFSFMKTFNNYNMGKVKGCLNFPVLRDKDISLGNIFRNLLRKKKNFFFVTTLYIFHER